MIRRTITFTVGYDETDDPTGDKEHHFHHIIGRWLYESIDWMRDDMELIVEDKQVFDPDDKRDPKDLF
jgi:hypothetical protein